MVSYIAVTALSHPGAVRDHHEDSLVAGPWTLCATVTESPQTLYFPVGTPLLAAVADGVGGHPAGEVASALVARQLAQAGPSLDSEESVREAIGLCHEAVLAAGSASPGRAGMATTVAGLVVTADQVLVFNVGDSRVYLAGPEGVRQLSTDDRPDDDLSPPGVITQTLGGGLPGPPEPHLQQVPLAEGTTFLICTDGLTDPLPPGLLEKTLTEHEDGKAAFELWKAAIEGGGPDNITMALVRLGSS